ncbi:MAG: hypothetical protein F6K56_01980 [Moorea sp. SIO3G5]|nr:hypothetical protein [Moorena sp. SIO3G5]
MVIVSRAVLKPSLGSNPLVRVNIRSGGDGEMGRWGRFLLRVIILT